MADFLAMGGYAAFVWPAWGAGCVVLAVITVHTVTRRNRASQKLAMLEMAQSPDTVRNKDGAANNG